MEGALKTLSGALQVAEKHPGAVSKIMMGTVPIIALSSLINLEPTGEVIGEYLKNKLVPDLEEANKVREAGLAGMVTMGERFLPEAAAMPMLADSTRRLKADSVELAMAQVDPITSELKSDPYLENIDEGTIKTLVRDVIRQAPNAVMASPSTVRSIVRSAALSGSDSIDIQTAKALLDLEKSYVL